MRPHTLDEMSTIILIFCRDGANKIELIEKCYLNDIERIFLRPQWLFLFCYTVKIKLNILTIEYAKRICYNAITSKKHSLFTMILYREIRLPKLLTADIFIPNW